MSFLSSTSVLEYSTPLDLILTTISPLENETTEMGMIYIKILMTYIVPILFSIIVVVGFLGNLLVIVVIIANTQMRSTTNILIISLALADLVFIVFCVPFTAVTYSTGGWPLGAVFCKIYTYTIYTTAYCSVYTLALMSLDRYLAVVHPLDSMTWRTQQNTVIAVIVTWIAFLTLNLPLLIGSDVVTSLQGNTTTHYCMYQRLVTINETTGHVTGDDKSFGRLYFSLFFFFGYLLPLTVICVLYGFMIERLLFGRTAKMSQSSEAMRSKRRVTRMIVVVIVLFALCWLPIQTIFMLQYYGPDPGSPIFRTIHVISNCLAYTNSMINPILYAFLSENFRRAFLKFLCGQLGRQPQEPLEFDRTQFPWSKSNKTTATVTSQKTTAATKLHGSVLKQGLDCEDAECVESNVRRSVLTNGGGILEEEKQPLQSASLVPLTPLKNQDSHLSNREEERKSLTPRVVTYPIYIETQIDC